MCSGIGYTTKPGMTTGKTTPTNDPSAPYIHYPPPFLWLPFHLPFSVSSSTMCNILLLPHSLVNFFHLPHVSDFSSLHNHFYRWMPMKKHQLSDSWIHFLLEIFPVLLRRLKGGRKGLNYCSLSSTSSVVVCCGVNVRISGCKMRYLYLAKEGKESA